MEGLKNFSSHRTPILARNGCVSSNNPLSSKAGLDILEKGGNAADAAVAAAAVMAVTEPASTGLGGDAFCIFYNAETRSLLGLNGSGKSPENLNLQLVESEGFSAQKPLPPRHVHTVTVPGTAAAWCDTVLHFGSGKLDMQQILAPAIGLAENGWPVTPVAAKLWQSGEELLRSHHYGCDLLLDNRAPRVAEIMTIPKMAESLRVLANGGKEEFYHGRIGKAIVEEITHLGGVLTMDDMMNHTSTLVDPIKTNYKDFRLWEIPPNGLGITALLALNILEGFDLKSLGLGSGDYLHVLIEAIKLSFADSLFYVSDTEVTPVPTEQLLSKEYASEKRKLISMTKANDFPIHGNLDIPKGSDTVYITVTDKQGNACSFINSNYMGFGTGIVPKDCGFVLQNRGKLFSLDPNHNNVLAPRKRTQHTIIPAMVTSNTNNELLSSFGVMGGYMQPQGHIQVLLGMTEFGLDPQQALDLPRFFIDIESIRPWSVLLEKEIPETVKNTLVAKGHNVVWPVEGFERKSFGRGHIITKGAWFNKSDINIDTGNTVWWGAADPRCDGYPMGY